MGLLDSLSKNGVTNLDSSGMYDKDEVKSVRPEPPVVQKQEVKEEFDESEAILMKKYTCPVCDYEFSSPTVKTAKIRQTGTKRNLHQTYSMNFEPLKYEPVSCPRCGYTVMAKFFAPLTSFQRKTYIENVARSYTAPDGIEDKVIGFPIALTKIKLALATSIVKKAKASEKAYICLKGYWLCESYLEEIERDGADSKVTAEEKEEIRADMSEFSQSAFDGFVEARQSERYPIAGMDEVTLDYLLAVMAADKGKYDIASKMIALILQSSSANSRIKDKARDLKEEIIANIRKRNG